MSGLPAVTSTAKSDGIFGSNAVMHPDNVRAFLLAARTEQGWSVEKAAEGLGVSASALRKLELTGRSGGLEDELRKVGWGYLKSFLGGGGERFTCLDNHKHPLASFADDLGRASFEVGNTLRARREVLGLSREEVCARVRDEHFDADDLEHIEWGRAICMGDEFEKLGKALGLPVLEILRLNGDFETEDIDEWIAWRDAQKAPTATPATAAGRRRKGKGRT